MSVGARLTLAGLGVTVIAVAVGVGLVPTHVSLGGGSIRCGTAIRPDRTSEVAPLCGAAGANHPRATLAVGVVLAVLALVPSFQLGATDPPSGGVGGMGSNDAHRHFGVASLGMVEYTPRTASSSTSDMALT